MGPQVSGYRCSIFRGPTAESFPLEDTGVNNIIDGVYSGDVKRGQWCSAHPAHFTWAPYTRWERAGRCKVSQSKSSGTAQIKFTRVEIIYYCCHCFVSLIMACGLSFCVCCICCCCNMPIFPAWDDKCFNFGLILNYLNCLVHKVKAKYHDALKKTIT